MNRKYSLILYKTGLGEPQEIARVEGPVMPLDHSKLYYDGVIYDVVSVVPCFDTNVLGKVTRSPVEQGMPDGIVYVFPEAAPAT